MVWVHRMKFRMIKGYCMIDRIRYNQNIQKENKICPLLFILFWFIFMFVFVFYLGDKKVEINIKHYGIIYCMNGMGTSYEVSYDKRLLYD